MSAAEYHALTDAQLAEAVEYCRKRSKDFREQLAAAEENKHDLLLEQIRRKWGVEIGSVVELRGKVYRVSQIETSYPKAKSSVRGHRQKKDGSFEECEVYIGSDWTLYESEPVPEPK